MVTLSEDHALLVQRFKFLDLVQSVAAADVAQCVDAVGVDALSAVAAGPATMAAAPNMGALPRHVRTILQHRRAAGASTTAMHATRERRQAAHRSSDGNATGANGGRAVGFSGRPVATTDVQRPPLGGGSRPSKSVDAPRRRPQGTVGQAPDLQTGRRASDRIAVDADDVGAPPPVPADDDKRKLAAHMLAQLMQRQQQQQQPRADHGADRGGAAKQQTGAPVHHPRPAVEGRAQQATTYRHDVDADAPADRTVSTQRPSALAAAALADIAAARATADTGVQPSPDFAGVSYNPNSSGQRNKNQSLESIGVGSFAAHVDSHGVGTDPSPKQVETGVDPLALSRDDFITLHRRRDGVDAGGNGTAAAARTAAAAAAAPAGTSGDHTYAGPFSADFGQGIDRQHHQQQQHKQSSTSGAGGGGGGVAVGGLLSSLDRMLLESDQIARRAADAMEGADDDGGDGTAGPSPAMPQQHHQRDDVLPRDMAQLRAESDEAARVARKQKERPARVRGRVPKSMQASILRGNEHMLAAAADRERQWNTSGLSAAALGNRFAASLVDDLLGGVIAEIDEALEAAVNEAVDDELCVIDDGHDDEE